MRIAAISILLVTAQVAAAYPQFQPARDVTCTGCHVSPDGAGLLNENGRTILETMAFKDMSSEFMYGKVPTPEWFQLGGDVRIAGGAFYNVDEFAPGAFPMQIDLQARASWNGVSANLITGFRPRNAYVTPLHVVWPREHYLMWQQKPDENYGLYVRAGHFMPTFGLRLAEHVVYTQRYGGRQLFHEAYAVAASYVAPIFEVHASAFMHDPYGLPAEHGDGASLYAEARIGASATVGTSGKLSVADEETVRYTGLTGKLHVESIDLALLAETQLVHRTIKVGAGDDLNQLVGYVMASKPLPKSLQLDVGVGHFTQDTRVKGLFRNCFDANVHFYATSHLELLLTTRVELTDGFNGPRAGYALTQLHYRL